MTRATWEQKHAATAVERRFIDWAEATRERVERLRHLARSIGCDDHDACMRGPCKARKERGQHGS